MATKRVIVIPADPSKPIHWRDVSGSLESLQGIVGGLIERVSDGHGRDFWCNEEGLLIGLPYNARASALCTRAELVGDVYVTGRGLEAFYAGLPVGELGPGLQGREVPR